MGSDFFQRLFSAGEQRVLGRGTKQARATSIHTGGNFQGLFNGGPGRLFLFGGRGRPPGPGHPTRPGSFPLEESFKNILEPSPTSAATAMMIMIVVMKQP